MGKLGYHLPHCRKAHITSKVTKKIKIINLCSKGSSSSTTALRVIHYRNPPHHKQSSDEREGEGHVWLEGSGTKQQKAEVVPNFCNAAHPRGPLYSTPRTGGMNPRCIAKCALTDKSMCTTASWTFTGHLNQSRPQGHSPQDSGSPHGSARCLLYHQNPSQIVSPPETCL